MQLASYFIHAQLSYYYIFYCLKVFLISFLLFKCAYLKPLSSFFPPTENLFSILNHKKIFHHQAGHTATVHSFNLHFCFMKLQEVQLSMRSADSAETPRWEFTYFQFYCSPLTSSRVKLLSCVSKLEPRDWEHREELDGLLKGWRLREGTLITMKSWILTEMLPRKTSRRRMSTESNGR